MQSDPAPSVMFISLEPWAACTKILFHISQLDAQFLDVIAWYKWEENTEMYRK
jgi:hypothetical protein